MGASATGSLRQKCQLGRAAQEPRIGMRVLRRGRFPAPMIASWGRGRPRSGPTSHGPREWL
eukprot:774443-Lingulodinium_polyedra.AAC.1